MSHIETVIISNTINFGTGDDLRVAFTKINNSIVNVNDYVSSLNFVNLPNSPTAIVYDTSNVALTLADSICTFGGNLQVNGYLSAIADGGTY